MRLRKTSWCSIRLPQEGDNFRIHAAILRASDTLDGHTKCIRILRLFSAVCDLKWWINLTRGQGMIMLAEMMIHVLLDIYKRVNTSLTKKPQLYKELLLCRIQGM